MLSTNPLKEFHKRAIQTNGIIQKNWNQATKYLNTKDCWNKYTTAFCYLHFSPKSQMLRAKISAAKYLFSATHLQMQLGVVLTSSIGEGEKV